MGAPYLAKGSVVMCASLKKSSHSMENILEKSSHGVIAQLHFIQMQPSAGSTTRLDLQQILDQYACVFAEPVGLPPS